VLNRIGSDETKTIMKGSVEHGVPPRVNQTVSD